MTLNKKVTMKDLLSEGLYILMQQKPFEKITIKQICDKTGVIRGTFYNHFMDKYEALEYLIHRMFYKGIEHESNPQIIKHIFQTVSDNRDFFKSCYRITGQNGFEDLMSNVFKEIFRNVFSYLDVSRLDSRFTVDFLVDFYANDLLYFLKYWISRNFEPDVETYYAKIDILFKNSIKELNIRYMDKS